MKQFNYEIRKTLEVLPALSEVKEWIGRHEVRSVLFHLFSMRSDEKMIREVQGAILKELPDAHIVGTSTNGDICDGHLADPGLVMSVSIFKSTDIEVRLFPCEPGQESTIGAEIREAIDSVPNIAAAETFVTLKTINCHKILNEVEKCRAGIPVFGGGSANEQIDRPETFVLDHDRVIPDAIALVIYKGDDLHIDIRHAIGWKPLGRDLRVTRIEGRRLFELDFKPAGDVYSKYLDIQADDDFFSNILEFPIMSHQHGFEVLRLPFSCRREDGSILLAADVEKCSTVNLSYGDPEVIRGDVTAMRRELEKFSPEGIFLYSCGVRRLYWKHLINKETFPFAGLAPTAGFYSSGEIMRMDNYLIEHHVTLIAVAMREGPAVKLHPVDDTEKVIEASEVEKMHGQISMVRRLATFINVTSAELREANAELRKIADTDELTGIYNRRKIEKLARKAINRAQQNKKVVMVAILDIDDFKKVNDTYGHAAGDMVLSQIAGVMDTEVNKVEKGLLGRWGGEEFLILLPDITLDDAKNCMERIRSTVEKMDFDEVGKKTLSIGLTEFRAGESFDELFSRADEALYDAKENGKNRVVVH
ncbi:diguanylate cyclase (GGDEF) domain-containing protein [Lachnospiraceae bacterium]|nr:diguanylate cyclase (GGDEF) domain-containing protein [Lachnospiraceae bacterium]